MHADIPLHVDIPLIGQIEQPELNDWLDAINSRAETFTVKPLEALQPEQLQKTEVAIVANPDPDVLNQLPNLKWVQSLWAGVEGLMGPAIKPDISIVRLTDPQMAESMAEAVLAWTLYLHRKMPHYSQQQAEKRWRQLPLAPPEECNVSIFGLGKLGSNAALRLRQNNFTVRGWSNSKKNINGLETFHGKDGFEAILPLTGIAVILLPLTSNTKSLFNTRTLSKLPTGASIINFARGPIVEETDLLDCLNNKQLDHAVLDVFNSEPLPQENILWAHPNVTVLPHISAPTTLSTAATIAAKNIDNYLKTSAIPESVDRSRGY